MENLLAIQFEIIWADSRLIIALIIIFNTNFFKYKFEKWTSLFLQKAFEKKALLQLIMTDTQNCRNQMLLLLILHYEVIRDKGPSCGMTGKGSSGPL